MPTYDSDKPMAIHGVNGRLTHRTTKPGQAPGLWLHQRWISVSRPIDSYGVDGARLSVEMRFDDECGNGHNTFAMTGEVKAPVTRKNRESWIAGGCLHDDIARIFPELAPLIAWHLTSSDGPMHYIANTLYHAGDRDCHGLRKGEKRQIRSPDGSPWWELVAINSLGVAISTTPTGLEYQGAESVPLFILQKDWKGETPPAVPRLEWRPSCRIGEGKPRDLAAARSCAVWPDATDAELMADPADLRAALERRHAGLVAAFRAAMDGAGFIWAPELMREEG